MLYHLFADKYNRLCDTGAEDAMIQSLDVRRLAHGLRRNSSKATWSIAAALAGAVLLSLPITAGGARRPAGALGHPPGRPQARGNYALVLRCTQPGRRGCGGGRV